MYKLGSQIRHEIYINKLNMNDHLLLDMIPLETFCVFPWFQYCISFLANDNNVECLCVTQLIIPNLTRCEHRFFEFCNALIVIEKITFCCFKCLV